MLTQKERFTRPQFQEFLKNKDILTVFNKLGTLKYTKKQKKLTIVTSGKHEKRAVVRNKLRRRIYSLFRQKTLNLQGVLYASKISYTLSYPEITNLFNDLLTRAQKNTK